MRDETRARADAMTPGRWHFGIRASLALVALVLALPFVGYSIYASTDEMRVERDHAAARLLAASQVVAARLDDQINRIRATLQVVGAVVIVDPARTEANDALLRRIASHISGPLDNLTVWTLSADDVGSLKTGIRRRGAADSAMRLFVKDVTADPGNDPGVDAPVVSIANSSGSSVFGIPVRRDGHVVGVVAADVRMDALEELTRAGADLPSSAVVTITDARGTILARSVDPDRWVGKTMDDAMSKPGDATVPARDGVQSVPGMDAIHQIVVSTATRSDHFKTINDRLGHAAGDLVLQEVARRLEEQVRSTDVVARLAGDEFVILVEGVHNLDALKAIAGKIIVSVRTLPVAHQSVRVTASMGVAIYDGREFSPAELLAAADRALYVAKRQGRDVFSMAGEGLAAVLDFTAVRDRTMSDRAA